MASTFFLRKKLIYRSLYRGCKETNILLRYFALKYLNKFSMNELIEYEKIVDLDDYDLYCYVVRKEKHPSNLDRELISLITYFAETNPLCTQ